MNADFLVFIHENEPLELRLGAEVEQEARFKIRGAQVIEQLTLVNSIQSRDGLQFEQHTPVHREIRNEVAYNHIAKMNRDSDLN